jgi:hypothetical protein
LVPSGLQNLGAKSGRFEYYFDQNLGSSGLQLCKDLVPRVPWDYEVLSSWFGGIEIDSFDFHADVGANGASHLDCGARDIHFDWTPGRSTNFAAMLIASEVVEVFEANFDGNWDCGNSTGEGLSRVLAEALYPGNTVTQNGKPPAAVWLDGTRKNWAQENDGSDLNYDSIGCAVLFLNWLRYQLGYSWSHIIGATASVGNLTLEHVYFQVTGGKKWKSPGTGAGWKAFKTYIDSKFPPGTPSNLGSNNPFPFLDGAHWSGWQSLGSPPGTLKPTWTPTVASRSPGVLDIVAGGEQDNAYWMLTWNGSQWQPWVSLGGKLTGGAAAMPCTDISVGVYGSGLDQKLWSTTHVFGPIPSVPWRPLGGGTFVGEPRVASWAPNRVDCFAINQGDLVHRFSGDYGVSFTDWQDLGRPSPSVQVEGYPAAIARGPKLLDIVAKGTDQFLWQISWNGLAWTPWRQIGIRKVVGDAALVSWAPNRLDIFVLDMSSNMSQMYSLDGGVSWNDGAKLGSPPGTSIFGSPGAVSWGPNRIDIFVIGADSNLWHLWWG